MSEDIRIGSWHHGPLHLFVPDTIYMVTASTFKKQHIFDSLVKLQQLQNKLFEVVGAYGWELQAWALFADHYHFVAHSPEDGVSLKRLIQRFHSQSARLANQIDRLPGRRVWFQYWDNCLTYERSYYARLNYVHNNPVKHGIVSTAEEYPFCSARWFEENTEVEVYEKVISVPYDRVNVLDDFFDD
jgi:putative transposase